MENIPKKIIFDIKKVEDRMKLLEKIKPLAWRTYMLGLAARNLELIIDFAQPVSDSALLPLNRLFDIDAGIFFTVSDEEIKNNPEVFLRPEE